MQFDRNMFSPGSIILLVAFIAGLLASVSLPTLSAIEVVRTHFSGVTPVIDGHPTIAEIRLGVWASCVYYVKDGSRDCPKTGHGYQAQILPQDGPRTIGASWTRGLAITPVATGVSAIALGMTFIPGGAWGLFASVASFLAAFLMFLAFLVDIALLAKVKSTFGIPGSSTHAGAGFWLTFVSFVFLCFAGCTVCIRHRRSDGGDIELGSFFKRFRR